MPTTSASDWRKAFVEGVELRFPSGFIGAVRPVSVETFFRLKIVPDSLRAIVQAMMLGAKAGESAPKLEFDEAQYVEFMDMLNQLAATMFVRPKVVIGEPQNEGEISAFEMDEDDKTYIFNLIGVGASRLEAFRQEQNGAVESVAADAADSPSSKRNPSRQRMGGVAHRTP